MSIQSMLKDGWKVNDIMLLVSGEYYVCVSKDFQMFYHSMSDIDTNMDRLIERLTSRTQSFSKMEARNATSEI